jgi:hypothetical protein
MIYLIAFAILFVIIWLSLISWRLFKNALEGNRYLFAWQAVIFIVTFVILSLITLFIIANSISFER